MNQSRRINNRYNELTDLEYQFYEEKAIELCAREIGATTLNENQLKIFQALREVYIKAVMKEEILNTELSKNNLFSGITIEHRKDVELYSKKEEEKDMLWYEIVLN